MQIILLQQVPDLGQKGDVKNVKDGYARNYLLARKLAAVATPALLVQADEQRKRAEEEKGRVQETYREMAKKLEGLSLSLQAKADEKGTLFGSIDAQEILAALKKKKYDIPQEAIRLEKDIKKVGEHEVHLDFGEGVKATIQIEVIAEKEK